MTLASCTLLLAATGWARSDAATPATPAHKKPAQASHSTSHSASSSTARSAGHSHATSSKSTAKSSRSRKTAAKKSSHQRGQQAMEAGRVKEIQQALIQANYLEGTPSGRWDDHSKAAMQRFQGDNGWQTKKVPDSRALIKLGLGPSRANLLNPNTAYIAQPEPAGKGGANQN